MKLRPRGAPTTPTFNSSIMSILPPIANTLRYRYHRADKDTITVPSQVATQIFKGHIRHCQVTFVYAVHRQNGPLPGGHGLFYETDHLAAVMAFDRSGEKVVQIYCFRMIRVIAFCPAGWVVPRNGRYVALPGRPFPDM